MPRKRNKSMGYVVIIAIAVAFIIVLNIKGKDNPNVAAENSQDPKEISLVEQKFKSSTPFTEIFYIPETRYYYVQQLKGEVTKDSADNIIKELFSKEAWKENGGPLGNVIIYGADANLKKGQRPNGNITEKAEYSSRSNEILISGKSYEFTPPMK